MAFEHLGGRGGCGHRVFSHSKLPYRLCAVRFLNSAFVKVLHRFERVGQGRSRPRLYRVHFSLDRSCSAVEKEGALFSAFRSADCPSA